VGSLVLSGVLWNLLRGMHSGGTYGFPMGGMAGVPEAVGGVGFALALVGVPPGHRRGGAPEGGGSPAPEDSGPSLRAELAAATGAAGLVLVVGALAYAGLWQYRRAAEQVEHTNRVRAALAGVSSFMSQAEAGARGYILTGFDVHAAQYDHAAGAARAALADARRLAADDPAQQQRLAVLAPVLDRRFAVLRGYMAERRTRGLAAAAASVADGRGVRLADSVRAAVAAAASDESRLLAARTRTLAGRGRLLDAVLLGGSLGACALILLVTLAIRRDVQLREAAEGRVRAQAAELEQQQMDLEVQLEEQQTLTEELAQTNTELQAAQQASAAALDTVRREEARYRALVEASAQIVWTTPPSGEFVGEQPGWAAFTGQTPAEYAGWGWLEAVHPDDRGVTAVTWEMALAGDGRFAVEHRLRRADPALHATPVVVLTTSGDERDKVDAYDLNVAGYLLKPVTFGSFVEIMVALNKYWTLVEMP